MQSFRFYPERFHHLEVRCIIPSSEAQSECVLTEFPSQHPPHRAEIASFKASSCSCSLHACYLAEVPTLPLLVVTQGVG